MVDREKVMKGLECCQYSSKSHCDGCPYAYDGLTGVLDCTADLAEDALALLEEHKCLLGTHITADGIYFTSSGTAEDGENRGIMIGKAIMHDRLKRELIHRELWSDEIRSVFEDPQIEVQ